MTYTPKPSAPTSLNTRVHSNLFDKNDEQESVGEVEQMQLEQCYTAEDCS